MRQAKIRFFWSHLVRAKTVGREERKREEEEEEEEKKKRRREVQARLKRYGINLGYEF